ncbi:acyltransferase [Cognatiyoonia sp. IB215182]|uniref:acyltransferase family protein n=1 Tax=Cognatiyoonia sp. IB215182 TaxID=3097353 RepID=UPI002A0CC6FA|nr:acyltransferase [Cognatiyoonia sp. IB215182]MDX8353762.1 acyltransferase [Cognatiyoonia sp. IB215182]
MEIRSHTSLRGIAALLVVVHHYRFLLSAEFPPDYFTLFFDNARYLVDFFFMLSGFIIAHVYSTNTGNMGRSEMGRFYLNRLARLYPLHVLTLFWTLLLASYFNGGVDKFLVPLLHNLFLVQAWGLESQYVLNFPSWSISGEFAAYLVFPLLAFIVHRGQLAAFALAAVSLGVIITYDVLVQTEAITWERIALLRALPGFALGVILYSLRHTVTSVEGSAISIFQVVAVACLVGLMHFATHLSLFIPVFGAIILLTWQDRGMLSALLAHPWLQWLGVLSYTIYMMHIPVRTTWSYAWPKVSWWVPESIDGIMLFTTCFALTLILSAFVYRLFELPARNAIRSFRRLKTT